MTKKFVAFLMALVLCIPMVSVALADACTHPTTKSDPIMTYSNPDPSTHMVNVALSTRCTVCNVVLNTTQTAQYREAHKVNSLQRDYHIGNKHVFYKWCTYCYYHTNQRTVDCPGNPHVSIVLSVPGGTVTE